MTDFHVIIPARFESTRLSAKTIRNIGNKTMIEHVCYQAHQCGAKSVTVATDDKRIFDVVSKAGYQTVMTKVDHQSGSDRVYEASTLLNLKDDDIIVNVQGDEPFIPPDNIHLVASLLNNSSSDMATLCCKIHLADELINPNNVKVIFNYKQQAIYFSRSVIPFDRNQSIEKTKKLKGNYFRHIGIYAYRKSFLEQFIDWQPSALELTESLEQLRVIENGHTINIAVLDESPPAGIDTPEDLQKAIEYYEANH